MDVIKLISESMQVVDLYGKIHFRLTLCKLSRYMIKLIWELMEGPDIVDQLIWDTIQVFDMYNKDYLGDDASCSYI